MQNVKATSIVRFAKATIYVTKKLSQKFHNSLPRSGHPKTFAQPYCGSFLYLAALYERYFSILLLCAQPARGIDSSYEPLYLGGRIIS